MTELPSKLFFRIGEVAGLVGVEPHVLRYWEREFRSIRPTKSAKGQRVYSRRDVENLLRVRDLLYRDGFTIAGAKKRLQRGGLAAGDAVSESESEREPESGHGHVYGAEGAVGRQLTPQPRASAQAGQAVKPSRANGAVRERLEAMRTEVEAFLGELETEGRDLHDRD